MNYKATLIKTAWYWHRNRYLNQGNRIKSLGVNSYNYSQLIFLQVLGGSIGEITIFSVNGAGKIGYPYMEEGN
jgi:hypothetical protein